MDLRTTGACGATSPCAAPASRSTGSRRSGPTRTRGWPRSRATRPFREAVAWQSRESLRARGRQARRRRAGQPVAPAPAGGRGRQLLAALLREERHDRVLRAAGVGRVRGRGRRDRVRSGALERERVVHFETWAMEAVAARPAHDAAADGAVSRARRCAPRLAGTTRSRRSTGSRPRATRSRRRAGATTSPPRSTRSTASSRRSPAGPPSRAEGDSGGGRTVAYLDCMRDLDLTLGPAVLDELRASLPSVLAASRWWCGRVFARGARAARARSRTDAGPLAPLLGAADGRGLRALGPDGRRAARAAAPLGLGGRPAFADWTPRVARRRPTTRPTCRSPRASADAIARGDFLVVLGDFHGGDNPLAQGLFGLRHPDPAAMMRRIAARRPGRASTSPRRAAAWSR